jgi:hypothetical protein
MWARAQPAHSALTGFRLCRTPFTASQAVQVSPSDAEKDNPTELLADYPWLESNHFYTATVTPSNYLDAAVATVSFDIRVPQPPPNTNEFIEIGRRRAHKDQRWIVLKYFHPPRSITVPVPRPVWGDDSG